MPAGRAIQLFDDKALLGRHLWQQRHGTAEPAQQQFRQPLMTAQLLLVKGTLETKDNVTHIIAGALFDYSHELQALRVASRDFH